MGRSWRGGRREAFRDKGGHSSGWVRICRWGWDPAIMPNPSPPLQEAWGSLRLLVCAWSLATEIDFASPGKPSGAAAAHPGVREKATPSLEQEHALEHGVRPVDLPIPSPYCSVSFLCSALHNAGLRLLKVLGHCRRLSPLCIHPLILSTIN